MTLHPYFQHQLALLEQERQADLELYNQLTQSAPIADRRLAGLTWYPIAIRNTELTRGDYLSVELERTTHQELNHQFRLGVSAVLFSNHDPLNDRIEGLVSFQVGNRLKLNIRSDELPDWAEKGKLGIELLFDNNSYEEMQSALKVAGKKAGADLPVNLIKVLIGESKPAFDRSMTTYVSEKLNDSQNESLKRILEANDVAVVHGPPGTGKTTSLVQAVKAVLERDDRQILVVAPSNAAVDLLSERLNDENIGVLRIGNPARVSDKLLSLTLDGKISMHPDFKQIRSLKKQANEFRNMAHKYKRTFGRAEREQRKALFDEAHKILNEAGRLEQFIQDDVIGKARVIAATLVGANHYTIKDLRFDTVFIDEAGQALEPACWIPILKARKVIFAGDPFQLPPTIKSELAARQGFETTLLEKVIRQIPEAVVLLEEQYRMHPEIMEYSSRKFYNGQLRAHHSVVNRRLYNGDEPLLFIDTAGCGFDEKQEGTSISNRDEAALVIRHLTDLVDRMVENKLQLPSIGIISPYKEQVKILVDLASENALLSSQSVKLSINTVDSFQGQERDVVYISLTRSNSDGVIGFLGDIRRMNVAMTRARKKLVIFGDSATLSRLKFYKDLVTYAESINGYRSAWEYAE